MSRTVLTLAHPPRVWRTITDGWKVKASWRSFNIFIYLASSYSALASHSCLCCSGKQWIKGSHILRNYSPVGEIEGGQTN